MAKYATVDSVAGYVPVGLGALRVYIDPDSSVADAIHSVKDVQVQLFGGFYNENGVLSKRVKEKKRWREIPVGGAVSATEITRSVRTALNGFKDSR
jgi:hypothetical protein